MPYPPQQNGAAERRNRRLVECARCLVHNKKLPIKLWAEEINTLIYMLIRSAKKHLYLIRSLMKYDLSKKNHAFTTYEFLSPNVTSTFQSNRGENGVPKIREITWLDCSDKDDHKLWPKNNEVVLSRDMLETMVASVNDAKLDKIVYIILLVDDEESSD
ncbi:Retrovirus-related Pol polyprotein like [Argiope bruennichi]|uniref:Retrovirus-related Pol polyprotein like n=1 Tax=Argiope bruennichi TaxID=94029 RepID=A0A8T0F8Y8_ARGBR|nr:Retrovirus-related Pol polyprotein like [Argiope bruennichi]